MGSVHLVCSAMTALTSSSSMAALTALLLFISSVQAHEYFLGQCPNFTPMSQFDWSKFSEGIWYVTQKFATKSSCLTYQFKTDNLGFKSIEQIRALPFVSQTGLEHDYVYRGKLYAPQESSPAKMIVRFPLNVAGAASFIVMDTDYNSYGLICTCQEFDGWLTYFNRRSCSILQRDPVEDSNITNQLKQKLDTDLGEDASHDFDTIQQAECSHGDDPAFTIDVDKILNGEEKDLVGLVNSDDSFDNDNYGDYEPDAEIIDPDQLQKAQEILGLELEGSQKSVEEINEEANEILDQL